MSWFDTSAGSVAGVFTRRRAGLQALPERNDQCRPDGPAWTWPPVVEQPTGSSAPAAQPAVLASAGNHAGLLGAARLWLDEHAAAPAPAPKR